MFQRVRNLVAAAITAALTITLLSAQPAAAFANGDPVTYTQTITTPANPAGNFSGSSGLDTWGIAVDNGKVYGVSHIVPRIAPYKIEITCQEVSTGANCTDGTWPLTVNDYAAAGSHPNFLIDSSHHMWIMARNGTHPNWNYYGLCIDLTNTASPICGSVNFATIDATALGMNLNGFTSTQSIAHGTKLYQVMQTWTPNLPVIYCFDTATQLACPSQPYRISSTSLTHTNLTDGYYDFKPVGNRIYGVYGGKIVCFDMNTSAECSGSWPVSETWGTFGFRQTAEASPSSLNENMLTLFTPHLETDGSITGVCYSKAAADAWVCRDNSGALVATPSGLNTGVPAAFHEYCTPSVITNYNGNIGMNVTRCTQRRSYGEPLIYGTRIYLNLLNSIVPATWNGNNYAFERGHVECFDFATNSACVGFSNDLTNMNIPYTLFQDPANPSCMWANGDSGSGQTQNFDAFTGGACGASGSRILASSYIEPGSTCAPVSYGTLKINSPTNYTTAKVTLLDASGQTLGVAQQTFNGSREVDLSSLTLPTASGSQPQMLVELRDGSNNLINSAIDMSLSWAGTYNSTCVSHGQTAVASVPVGPSITSAAEVTVEKGTLPVLTNTTDITSPTWSIDGGANSSLFTIDASGVLKFKTAQPVGDYVVIVKATHGGDTATKTVTVHVVDTTPPAFDLAPSVNVEQGTTGSFIEPTNTSELGSFTVIGPDALLFTFNPMTGALTLLDPNQAIGDYNVSIRMDDGSGNYVVHSTVVHVVAHLEVGSPAPATRTNVSGGKTRVNWTAATNAVTYKVKLGSTVLCTTSNLTCTINHRYVNSKHLYVHAYASNNDTKSALAVPQDVVVPNDKVKLGMVHFALDSSYLDITAVRLLNKYIKAIKKAGYTKVFIYGHTDNQGPAPHDVSLSNRRARQVWLYLKSRLHNVTFVRAGYSRTKPAKANSSQSNKAYNRRAEIWGS